MRVVWMVLALTALSGQGGHSVTFPRKHTNSIEEDDELRVCIKGDDPILSCFTSGAVKGLEYVDDAPELDLGNGLTIVEEYRVDTKASEGKGDPREPKTFLDSLSGYMERRFLNWDLSDLYPGLLMRVGPSSSRGYLQFLLDHRRMVDDRSLSTGRLILKRTLLPVLLGVKFNVVSLVPLLFAALIILIKKALILSKFSFLLSGLSYWKAYQQNLGTWSGSESSGGLGSYGGGSFSGPPKHIIFDRPTNHNSVWFARENPHV